MSDDQSKKFEITPPKGLIRINPAEIWRYRELFYIFAWRDIKVRYKQTFFGIGWAIFQPFFTMLIFSIFFGRLAKVPSDGVPYPIFVYSGLLLWNYFAGALSNISDCLVGNEGIVKKVYFPRLILPLSTAVTPVIDFVFAFSILFLLMVYYHYTPSILGLLLIPILIFISFLTASGIGFFLSSVNVKYRDVRYILPFFIQLMLFLTPIIYPVSLIPAQFQWVIFLNPMAGVITIARSSLLHTGVVNWQLLPLSLGIGLFLFLIGIAYFRRAERFFADIM
jgi:lipopolysaccharide transport system permease protein